MKQRPRKLPVGWRVLTPSERIKEGDYCTSKDNLKKEDSFWQSEYCQSKLLKGEMSVGYCLVDHYAFGKLPSYCKELLYITKKTYGI